jgi:dihydrofolate reductase
MQEDIQANVLASDAALYGRVTYEAFAPFWPSQTGNAFGLADKLNNQPKYVVSTTLQKADWNNTTLIKNNVAEEISRLKQQPGGSIALTGSATLIRSLMQDDLIDEFRLYLHPIVVAHGKRLFTDGMDTTALKLVSSRTFDAGVIVLTYQPAQNPTR